MTDQPRLLIVDDDDVLRESVRRQLTFAQFAFFADEAGSVDEAFAALRAVSYDCMVLDYRMGDGDAFDLFERCTNGAVGERPPVVMITAQDDVNLAVRAMKHGVHDFITKDALEPELLRAAVEHAIEVQRLKQEGDAHRRELEWLSLHDGLTGLANRYLFNDRLGHSIEVAERAHGAFAVLMIDINLFKTINDTLGHAAGDEALQKIGARLGEAARQSDTVARLGGDEFALLLEGTDSMEGAVVVAEKLAAVASEPMTVGGQSMSIELAIGIALYPQHGQEPEALLRHADLAMYQAKRAGQRYAVFEPDNQSPIVRRSNLIATKLRASTFTEQVVLHYQPKISLLDGQITGVETLVRWRHPELGLLPPAEFVPAAERTTAIRPLTLSVVDRTLNQVASWGRAGLVLPAAVNLSARMLDYEDLPGLVLQSLRRHGVSPHMLTLEVTETGTMASPTRAARVLGLLAGQGVRISIDDFGTGYTSFRYLRDFPIAEIKIDHMFVDDLERGTRDASIIRSIAELGKGFGVAVVAEGIESRAVWRELIHLGCEFGQGYFISRPLSALELVRWHSGWERGHIHSAPAA